MDACSDQALAFAISNGVQNAAAIKRRVADEIADAKMKRDQELAASQSAAFTGSLLLSMAGILPAGLPLANELLSCRMHVLSEASNPPVMQQVPT